MFAILTNETCIQVNYLLLFDVSLIQQRDEMNPFSPLLNTDFLVFDTETTGLDGKAEICEIAVIDSKGSVLMNTLVKPTCSIPADATKIHGITDADVEFAPKFDEVFDTLLKLVMSLDVPLVAYNAGYDARLIKQSIVAYSTDYYPLYKKIASYCHCAMFKYAEYYGEWNEDKNDFKWQSLSNAMKQQGLEISNAHRALGDSKMTLALINKVLGY